LSQYNKLKANLSKILDNIPNMLSEDVPVGMSEQDNKLIKHYTLKKKKKHFRYCITNEI